MSNNLTPAERIKTNSDGLRGTLKQSLEDHLTGALREDDQTLIKHHGMYQQDDRDLRESRSQKKLEWLYSFMIRLRLPGGFLTPAQWVAMHHIAGEHSTGVIKITTRQTICYTKARQYRRLWGCQSECHLQRSSKRKPGTRRGL